MYRIQIAPDDRRPASGHVVGQHHHADDDKCRKSLNTLNDDVNDCDDENGVHDCDKYAFVDARKAVQLIDGGHAVGNRLSLWFRSQFEVRLYKFGRTVHRNAVKVLLIGVFILIASSVGLKSSTLVTDIEKLWIDGKKCPHVRIFVAMVDFE